jgi:two-component system OmpR family response regulator
MSDGKKKILIVDDDKFLREMYVNKFSSSGFDVDSVGSVREAVERFEDGASPDVILFDIIMPVEDGWSLAQKIKDNNYIPNAKKIVLSNQGEDSDKEQGKKFNVDSYIIKALNTPSEVVEKVIQISNK